MKSIEKKRITSNGTLKKQLNIKKMSTKEELPTAREAIP